MQLLPKQDKKGTSHNPRVVAKRHLKKVDLVLWVCCATVGLGSVLSAAAIVVGRRSEVSPSVSKVNRALEMTQSRRRAYIEKLTRTDFNPNELQNYGVDGSGILTGWRQLGAAKWSGEILQDINKQQSNECDTLSQGAKRTADYRCKLGYMTRTHEKSSTI